MAVGPDLAGPCLGDVIGDVSGERGFAHARAAGKNDQVRGLQAAHLAVEIGQAHRQPGKAAVALVSARRHVNRGRQRLGEALKAGIVTARLCDLVEPPLGVFDVLQRSRLNRCVIGEVHHILTDRD